MKTTRMHGNGLLVIEGGGPEYRSLLCYEVIHVGDEWSTSDGCDESWITIDSACSLVGKTIAAFDRQQLLIDDGSREPLKLYVRRSVIV